MANFFFVPDILLFIGVLSVCFFRLEKFFRLEGQSNNRYLSLPANQTGTGLNKHPSTLVRTTLLLISKFKIMAKRNCKKSKSFGKEKRLKNAQDLLERGELFGDSIIGLMAQFATNLRGLGVAAAGLAKALAALKTVADEVGVDLDDLYNGLLENYEKDFFLSGFEFIDFNEK